MNGLPSIEPNLRILSKLKNSSLSLFIFLTLSACSEKEALTTMESDHDEKQSMTKPEPQEFVGMGDWPESLKSRLRLSGGGFELPVEKGKQYRVRVYKTETKDVITDIDDAYVQQVIHDELFSPIANSFKLGVYCSLGYKSTDGKSSVDQDKTLVTLEAGAERFVAEVKEWGYQPFECISMDSLPGLEERPCMVVYHPNNMGPTTFEEAANYAKRVPESLVVTLQAEN